MFLGYGGGREKKRRGKKRGPMRPNSGVLSQFKSTFHRVRAPRPGEYKGPRYSIAFFNQVNKSSVIAGPGGKYPPVTGEEFMKAAMKRNYDALEALRLYKASGLQDASSGPELAACS
jgi:hypothetical protein